jgi:REP element-mobilizing transposase RayT
MRKPALHSNTIYHVYNRGVSKRALFLCEADYRRFMYKMAVYKQKYDISIIRFCIMPNHFHLLLRTSREKSRISSFMKSIQTSYAFYFNKKYKHTGHVFQGAFRNKTIKNDDYLMQITKYIAENPVRRKLVAEPRDWPYSG